MKHPDVRFGKDVYRDRMDINEDEFYQRLLSDQIHPDTKPPTPQDITDAYRKLFQEADGILSIHISGKLNATCNTALRGKGLLETEFPIEVIDSQFVTMGLGLLVIAAHNLTNPEKSLLQVVEKANQVSRLGPVLGVLGEPGILFIALRAKD
ncbi:DegV family protein [Chloroflexota bacterium]